MRSKFSILGLSLTVAVLAVALWLDHRRLNDATRVASWTYAVPPNSAVGARLLKTLKDAYSDVSTVSMNYDEAKGELEIIATPSELSAIRAAMDVMEEASSAQIAAEQAANDAVTR
jgi:hypothetical protein